MKKIYKIFLSLLVIGTLAPLVSCNESAKQAPPPPEIEVTNVIIQDVPIYRDFVGQAYGLQDIPVRARVDGFLELINFAEGSRVTKGQVLYNESHDTKTYIVIIIVISIMYNS